MAVATGAAGGGLGRSLALGAAPFLARGGLHLALVARAAALGVDGAGAADAALAGVALGADLGAADLLGHAVLGLEREELVEAERAPLAGAEALAGDPGEADPGEPHHREAAGLAHATDLLVPALAQGDLEPGLAVLVAEEVDVGGGRLAVLEGDAVGPVREVVLGHHAAGLDHVRLGDAAARVEQAVGEVAVVGDQEDAAGGEVEPAHRVEAGAGAVQQAHHRGATLGIGEGGDHAAGLVEHQVARGLGDEAAAVDLDDVDAQVGPGTQLADHLAVHADAPGQDELLAGAPRGDARSGNDLLQSFLHGGVTLTFTRLLPAGRESGGLS